LSSFAPPDAQWNIYREEVTGPRPDRRELNRMLGKLAPGDVVTVTRIDRLARSTFDLFGIVKRIVDTKAQFRSLAEPWADTGTRCRARPRRSILGISWRLAEPIFYSTHTRGCAANAV
jgi:hypothetical protein